MVLSLDRRGRKRALLTTLLCLPVSAFSALTENILVSFGIVGMAVAGNFLALTLTDGPWWASRRVLRAFACAAPLLIAVGISAVVVQGRWPSTDDVPTLLKTMESNDTMVQHRAVTRLEQVGGTGVLLSALEHPHPNVRYLAARSLQDHPSYEVRRALQATTEDPSPRVAQMASFSLEKIRGSRWQ
jgi:hypothetical protein